MLLRTLLIASAAASIVIGHPVPATLAFGKQLTFTSAILPLQSSTFDRCDGTEETFTVNEDVNLLDNDTITLAKGNVCGVTLTLSDTFVVSGTSAGGGSFDLELEVGTIEIPVSPKLVVTNTSNATEIRIAVEDWVTENMLGIANGSYVLVNHKHSLHNSLRDHVRWDSEVIQ